MGKISIKRFSSPDEKRAFVDKGYAEILSFEGATVGRAVFEPGWKWSTHNKPIAGTDSCQATHAGFVVSGRMHIACDEGEQADLGPGDVFSLSPGHDAWVIGNDTCVVLDFAGMSEYAKPRGAPRKEETSEASLPTS